MRRFLAKLCLLAMPLLVLGAAELLLPPEAFTFRAWEALKVTPLLQPVSRLGRVAVPTALPGPFLPGIELAMVEQGDLGHHTPFAEHRSVIWRTDEFGYRASPGAAAAAELVIVGDSNAVGSGLPQEDILAEVLGRRHGVPAYTFAPSTVPRFLAEERFRGRPPRFLLIECIERTVLSTFQRAGGPEREPKRISNQLVRRVEAGLVRLLRMNALAYLRARITDHLRAAVGEQPPTMARRVGGMFFLTGTTPATPPDPAHVVAAADTLARYAEQAQARGLRAAVLVIPDKETIYSDDLPRATRPTLLPLLHAALRARGVPVIDVESAFRAARASGEAPYFSDDTHWNAAGVRLTAAAVASWVEAEMAGGQAR